ncbi:glycosyltransferase [Methylorubrum populi]
MPSPRILFVNHTSTVAGAELILADLVGPWQGATAFLFEDGPLNTLLGRRGLTVLRARPGPDLSALRRDASPLRALPVARRLVALTSEIARQARIHDVVYANSQKAFLLAAPAAAALRRPLIWHLHDILDADHFGSAQRRLQIWLANACAARVIVPSAAAAAAFIAAGGRESLVAIVPNGLSVAPDPRPAPSLRRSLGLPEGPVAGVFSRIAPWKGQHVFLQALAALPGARGVVVGAPLFGEDAYADRLRSLAAELGIADRLSFLGHRDDVPRLMQAVDVVVHPSVHPEPFGRTLVEAMLAGTPVIATETGAAGEILDGGRLGTLVAPGDPAALAAAMGAVLTGGGDRAERIAAARLHAQAAYSVDRMQQGIAQIIADVAGTVRR